MEKILVFNLANEIDEEQSLKKIEDLKKEAKESAKNRSRVWKYFKIQCFLVILNIFFKDYFGTKKRKSIIHTQTIFILQSWTKYAKFSRYHAKVKFKYE